MTEIATIGWFGRLGKSVFSENTAIFFTVHWVPDSIVNFFYIIIDLVPYLRQGCKHGDFVSFLVHVGDISNFADTVLRLQRKIDKKSFCKCVKMKINLHKTKIVAFRNGECLNKCKKVDI